MNQTLQNLHEQLDNLYGLGEEIFEQVKDYYKGEVAYGFYKGHYIKINNVYEYQKYPLPVITVSGVGDIGVNLDKIWLEYVIHKNDFHKFDLDRLKSFYTIEIYSAKDCLIDFYIPGDTKGQVINKLKLANEEKIGIAIYIEKKMSKEVGRMFFSIHKSMAKE